MDCKGGKIVFIEKSTAIFFHENSETTIFELFQINASLVLSLQLLKKNVSVIEGGLHNAQPRALLAQGPVAETHTYTFNGITLNHSSSTTIYICKGSQGDWKIILFPHTKKI